MKRIATIIIAIAATNAAAEPTRYVRVSTASTEQIAEICAETQANNRADYCTGYILATYDQLSLNEKICPPPGATSGQAAAIGRKFIADHPERWATHPGLILTDAFKAAFPCR